MSGPARGAQEIPIAVGRWRAGLPGGDQRHILRPPTSEHCRRGQFRAVVVVLTIELAWPFLDEPRVSALAQVHIECRAKAVRERNHADVRPGDGDCTACRWDSDAGGAQKPLLLPATARPISGAALRVFLRVREQHLRAHSRQVADGRADIMRQFGRQPGKPLEGLARGP